MSKPIYEPTGRALEYSPLALNLYDGCLYACKYCYAPSVCFATSREAFHSDAKPRKNILDKLEKQCKKMRGDPREVLLCFTCDPYQPLAPSQDITREALLILEKFEMKVQILTKGGYRAARDFDILARNGWKFGTTMIFYNDERGEELRQQWEPGAAFTHNRLTAIMKAKEMGIYTWISLEPTIDPVSALHLIVELRDTVDHWKIGKVNYHAYIEKKVDWNRYYCDLFSLLHDKDVYVKKDLLDVVFGQETRFFELKGWKHIVDPRLSKQHDDRINKKGGVD